MADAPPSLIGRGVMRITLTGEPKSTQHIYRNTCRGGYSSTYMSSEGKAIKEGYQWES